jgi:hypothetical protein
MRFSPLSAVEVGSSERIHSSHDPTRPATVRPDLTATAGLPC